MTYRFQTNRTLLGDYAEGLVFNFLKTKGEVTYSEDPYDDEKDMYVIVDGFHRYYTCKTNKDIYDRNKGYLPCVVIEKDINERMAATVRHNRARGEHSVSGMGNMVFEMLSNGWTDDEICNHLGMEPEEILKLKHITGFSKLFADKEFNKSWQTNRMIKIKKDYENGLK